MMYIAYFLGAFNYEDQKACLIGFTQNPTKPLVYDNIAFEQIKDT